MKKVDLYISNSAPNVKRGDVWLKPVNGGYALYVLDSSWKPVKTVDDSIPSEDNNNTAESAAIKSELLGSEQDTASEMTLYGLKAYIDEQIAGIEQA